MQIAVSMVLALLVAGRAGGYSRLMNDGDVMMGDSKRVGGIAGFAPAVAGSKIRSEENPQRHSGVTGHQSAKRSGCLGWSGSRQSAEDFHTSGMANSTQVENLPEKAAPLVRQHG